MRTSPNPEPTRPLTPAERDELARAISEKKELAPFHLWLVFQPVTGTIYVMTRSVNRQDQDPTREDNVVLELMLREILENLDGWGLPYDQRVKSVIQYFMWERVKEVNIEGLRRHANFRTDQQRVCAQLKQISHHTVYQNMENPMHRRGDYTPTILDLPPREIPIEFMPVKLSAKEIRERRWGKGMYPPSAYGKPY